jgi:hypothetical protein
MKTPMVIIAILISLAPLSADVQWSRLNGTVKGINGKRSEITVQNKEGDLLTITVTDDVSIVRKKDVVKLKDVAIDDRVTLVNIPKAPAPKEGEDENAYTGRPLPNK